MAAVAVVAKVLFLLGLLFSKLFKPLLGAVTVVCLAAFHQFFCIFAIKLGTFRLYIWAVGTAHHRALIPLYPQPFQGGIKVVQRFVRITLSVGVLYAQ